MNQSIQTRLRDAVKNVRTKSYPLSDLIPLMQQAADALDYLKASSPIYVEPSSPINELQKDCIGHALTVYFDSLYEEELGAVCFDPYDSREIDAIIEVVENAMINTL